jgi:hypothetical protein
MSVLVGIDALVCLADVSDIAFNGGSGGNPTANELPTWDPATKTVSWDGGGTSPWTEIPERNEFSVDLGVDVAEWRPFVAALEDAWVQKARTWMSWSGSMSGAYDDADDTLLTKMKAGFEVWLIFFDSRYIVGSAATPSTYWLGKALLTNVSHSTGSEDFSTFDCDFEGTGPLYRSSVPS